MGYVSLELARKHCIFFGQRFVCCLEAIINSEMLISLQRLRATAVMQMLSRQSIRRMRNSKMHQPWLASSGPSTSPNRSSRVQHSSGDPRDRKRVVFVTCQTQGRNKSACRDARSPFRPESVQLPTRHQVPRTVSIRVKEERLM